MTKGDPVVWVRGAVGLTGRVVDFLLVTTTVPWNLLFKIETERGVFYEYPHNLDMLR